MIGIDYSPAVVQKSQDMKMKGQATYKLVTEGDLGETKTATIATDIVSG